MNYSKEEVKDFIEQEDVKFVRLAFCDINGKQKNISISPTEIDRAFDEGISFDASAIEGFGNELTTDLMLHPISKTLNILPWRPSHGKVIRMFCNIKHPDGTPFELDSRQILQNAVKEAKAMGLTVQIGTEFEFYLFKTDENGNKTNIPFDNAGYMDVAPEDKGENVRREICLTLLEMGINPESSLHLDGPGQNEIDFRYADAITAADNAMNFVSVVKAAALHNGLYADFSPKPIMDKPGNGMHINISVKSEDGEFYNARFMAGVMEHICEITAFLNTKEDSYKRLGEHTAPKYVTWTKENRSQLLRVPERRNEHKRFELRSADPCANPYLAFAALIYAGLDGIKRNLTLPAPFDTNIKDSDQTVKDSLKMLPDSLEAAVQLATQSEFVKSVIPQEVLNLL